MIGIRGSKLAFAAVLASLGALTAACGNSQPAAQPSGAPDIAGKYRSACTPNGNQRFVLDFDIRKDSWGLDYIVYGDDSCAQKFLTVRIEGPYEVDGASDAVTSANDAVFRFTKKTVTPHAAAAVGFLESEQGCNIKGFKEGEATDIGQTGCAALGQRPIAQCGADYDLVQVDAEGIRFGDRPQDNDMCTPEKRPKALSPLVSRRVGT
jgi:hypothetical protein